MSSKILEALRDHAGPWVVRADDVWLQMQDGAPDFAAPSGCIRRLSHAPRLWIEFDLA